VLTTRRAPARLQTSMTTPSQPPPWRYEPDEVPKRKHHWNRPEAGFAPGRGEPLVAKCPNTMSIEVAEALLEEAFPWSPDRWPGSYPKRLYAVHEGVVYRATPTNRGVSYHGFPEHPTKFPPGRSGRDLKKKLLARARECPRARL
jgi:hypothetical protein